MQRTLSALLVAAFAATLFSAMPVRAQDQTIVLPSPIMVVDFERVFGETLYGQRIAAELDAERALVQAENDRLAEELLSEESELTDARTTMDQETFRDAAEAFNEKAQTVRASREAEQARLVNLRDTERARFLERIQPVLSAMMVERGAIVAMDRRSVIQAIGSANATESVIERINETLGDGRQDPAERPNLRPSSGDNDRLILPEDNIGETLSTPQ